MKVNNFKFTILLLVLTISLFNVFTFAGDEGYYCDPKTKVCYPPKENSDNTWTKKDPTETSKQFGKHSGCFQKGCTQMLFNCVYDKAFEKSLNLNKSQAENINGLKKNFADELANLTEKQAELNRRIDSLLNSETLDFKKLEQSVKEVGDIKTKKALLHLKYYKELYKILDTTQKKLLAPDKPTAGKEAMKYICPVMGREVNDIKTAPSYEYKGKTYYFCCPSCIDVFKKNPKKYIK